MTFLKSVTIKCLLSFQIRFHFIYYSFIFHKADDSLISIIYDKLLKNNWKIKVNNIKFTFHAQYTQNKLFLKEQSCFVGYAWNFGWLKSIFWLNLLNILLDQPNTLLFIFQRNPMIELTKIWLIQPNLFLSVTKNTWKFVHLKLRE